jgi:hypothetical protein
MNISIVDTRQIHAELTEQINRARNAASAFTTGPLTAEMLADRAERVWRTDFPNLARMYDTTTPATNEGQKP